MHCFAGLGGLVLGLVVLTDRVDVPTLHAPKFLPFGL